MDLFFWDIIYTYIQYTFIERFVYQISVILIQLSIGDNKVSPPGVARDQVMKYHGHVVVMLIKYKLELFVSFCCDGCAVNEKI